MAEHFPLRLTDEHKKALSEWMKAAGRIVADGPGGLWCPRPGVPWAPTNATGGAPIIPRILEAMEARMRLVLEERAGANVGRLSGPVEGARAGSEPSVTVRTSGSGPSKEPDPFGVDDDLYLLAGTRYRIRPQADMTPRECYWLLRFQAVFPADGEGHPFDEDSVLAWLAERNLLRHLEPAGGEPEGEA